MESFGLLDVVVVDCYRWWVFYFVYLNERFGLIGECVV